MSQVFQTQFTLRFREADPAQMMFFGNILGLAHDAYEEFIVAVGYPWKEWFRKGDEIVPIRHAESDFLIPFKPGESYEIAVTVPQIRETSFQTKYVFSRNGKTHAIVNLVHAVIDSATMQKKAVPTLMRERLEKFLEVQS
ncbi:MAG: acyl-CoA thioesterase [Bdellovibrionaceae bacterium]|nr:acyl-CoA thioesterase [Pseudobdellovibrionaceae bacterium]